MIYITITQGASTWYVSEYSHTHDGVPYDGRLLNAVKIVSQLSEAGTSGAGIDLQIKNPDRWISGDLWTALVEVELPSGLVWHGEVKAYDHDGEGTLYVSASDLGLPELDLMIPDEVAHVFDVSDLHSSFVDFTVPIALGGTAANPLFVKGILISKTSFVYLLSVGGPLGIRSVAKVYKGTEEITTGFTAYTGTADQAVYPGFACIVFDSDPRNDDGTWPEIYADVVGVKLGTCTEAECRNPARILYYLLTTARSGIGAWGLGVDSAKIDTDSFNQAVADCDTFGFHIDGVIHTKQQARYWVDQITRACRGNYFSYNGKRYLSIGKTGSSVQTYDLSNMRLERHGKGNSSKRRNRVVIDYRYNPITGSFTANEPRDDSASIGLIKEQKFSGQLDLVSEQATAGAIADFELNRSKFGEDRIYFGTLTPAQPGQVITINRPDLDLNNALFCVTSLDTGPDEYLIDAQSYSDSIYTITTPGTAPAEVTGDLPVTSAYPPAAPSGLDVHSDVDILPDGSVIPYIYGSFTLPAGAYLGALVQWGIGATPAAWTVLGTIKGNTFRLSPVIGGTTYTLKVTAINSAGSSPSITSTIVAATDSTAPLVPQAPVLSTYFKSIAVKCLQNLTMASDHASFDVYRNTANDSGTAVKVGSAPCLGNTDSVVYLDEATAFDTTYYYWVKSVDTSGNVSGFSAVAGPVSTQRIISGDLAAGALNNSVLFAAGVVDAAALADCAVTAAKTALAAVDRYTGKIALAAIDNPNMFTGRPVDSTVVTTGELLTLSAQIKDAIVTSAKIASLDAGKITTGSLDAGRIAAGSLLGCHIAANTITASNLLIAAPGAALNDDPGFLDPSAWTVMDGYETYTGYNLATVSDGKVGTGVLRGNAGTAPGYNSLAGCRYIPIDPTKVYRLRAWIRARGTTNGCVYLSVREYNNGKCTVSSNLGTYIISGAAPNTTWTAYAGYIGPSGASGLTACFNAETAWVRVGALLDYNTTCAVGYEIQDFRLEEVLPATLIQDGAITTTKILANSICSGHICSGGISGACITAGSITADRLCVGDLCAFGATIGGWTIKSDRMCKNTACGADIGMYSAYYGQLYAGMPFEAGTNNRTYAAMGQMFWSGSGTAANGYGFSVGRSCGGTGPSFAAGMAATGIVTLPDASTVAQYAPFLWVGDSASYLKYNAGKVTIRGDLQVLSGGNILPDPDFRGISPSDACKYYWPASSSVIGEWRVYFAGVTQGVLALHKQSAYCTALRYPGSNAFRLCACSVSSYAYVASANYFPIKGCTAYLFSGYFARETSTAVKVYAGMFFYNASGTCVGGADNTLLAGEDVTTTLTRRSACIVSPAAAAYASIIVYNYHPAAVSYLHVSALSVQELNSTSETDAPWNVGTSGSITANMVKTGCMLSMNWGTAAGSCFDLNAGTFYLGGSSAPSLSWDGSSLVVRGTVCATAGCFSGAITSCSGNIGGWSLACDRLYQYVGVSGTQICAVLSQTMYRLKYIVPLLQGNEITLQSAVCSATSDCAAILINTGGDAARWGLCTNGKIQVASVCCTSDRNAKENIVPVSVLGRIRNLPISEWSFKGDLIRHVSPMAQDFYEVFKGYSSDPKAIGGLDGIALKGVQELDGCVESLKTCIRSLEDRLCNLETRLAA